MYSIERDGSGGGVIKYERAVAVSGIIEFEEFYVVNVDKWEKHQKKIRVQQEMMKKAEERDIKASVETHTSSIDPSCHGRG